VELLETRNLLSFSVTNYTMGVRISGVLLADFQNQGVPDLVSADFGPGLVGDSGTATIRLNNGHGTFGPPQTLTVGGQATDAGAGDFRHSGNLDLLVSNRRDAQVLFFAGNGDGTFAPPTIIPAVNGVNDIVVGDFNGDGNLDFATANFPGPDAGMSVFLGNGDGTFSRRDYATRTGAIQIAAADFENDGDLDLVVSTRDSGGAQIFLNNGDGTFRNDPHMLVSNGTFIVGVATGDLTGNGNQDVVLADTFPGRLAIFWGNGDGTFSGPTYIDTHGYATPVVIADFNQDGILDIATANQDTGQGVVLLGNGDGTFRAPQFTFVDGSPLDMTSGDVNGDGYPDLAAVSWLDLNTSYVAVMTNNQDFRPVGGGASGIVATPAQPTIANPSQLDANTLAHALPVSSVESQSQLQTEGPVSEAQLFAMLEYDSQQHKQGDSPGWNNDRGAVTGADGTVGITGTVDSSNSLVGSNSDDFVGLTALSNGNYVVYSYAWGGNRGAVTWGDETVGITVTPHASNSLVGTYAKDYLGFGGIMALRNGNYVISSPAEMAIAGP
jgi:hypothetical protein